MARSSAPTSSCTRHFSIVSPSATTCNVMPPRISVDATSAVAPPSSPSDDGEAHPQHDHRHCLFREPEAEREEGGGDHNLELWSPLSLSSPLGLSVGDGAFAKLEDAHVPNAVRWRVDGVTAASASETPLFKQDIESYVAAMVVKIPAVRAAENAELVAVSRPSSAKKARRAPTHRDGTGSSSAPASKAGKQVKSADDRSLYPPKEEARRERNRLKVRRMYYRKLERLANLRTDMAQFETTLQTILAARSSGTSYEHALVPNAARDLIMTRMAKIERVLETLERENDTLKQILFQHEQELNRIQQSLQRLEQVNITSLSGNIKIKHLSRVECFELRNRSLDDVRAFERSKYQLASGGKVCGWDNLQLVQDNVLKFYVEKRVSSFRVDQMAALSWSVVRDPERFKSLHSNAVGMKCHTVQCIDDDNIVRFHEHLMMNSNNECLTVKTIVFLSRLQTANGYLILLRSMDPTTMVIEDLSLDECLGRVLWNDHFFWLEYTSDTSGLCRCTFAGLASMVGANAYARMIELMQIAVRWEAMTIGAAWLLPSED